MIKDKKTSYIDGGELLYTYSEQGTIKKIEIKDGGKEEVVIISDDGKTIKTYYPDGRFNFNGMRRIKPLPYLMTVDSEYNKVYKNEKRDTINNAIKYSCYVDRKYEKNVIKKIKTFEGYKEKKETKTYLSPLGHLNRTYKYDEKGNCVSILETAEGYMLDGTKDFAEDGKSYRLVKRTLIYDKTDKTYLSSFIDAIVDTEGRLSLPDAPLNFKDSKEELKVLTVLSPGSLHHSSALHKNNIYKALKILNSNNSVVHSKRILNEYFLIAIKCVVYEKLDKEEQQEYLGNIYRENYLIKFL